MKTLLINIISIMLFFTIYSSIANAAAVNWQDYSNSVFEQAKKDNRPVVIFSKSESCQWCQKMTKTTLRDDGVVKLLNEKYTPVLLDVDNNYEIANQFKIMDLPTTIVFDADGNVVKAFSGYMTAQEFLNNMQNVRGS